MTSVGRFELKALLGKGGSASVWRAFDPDLRRDVALKLVEPGRRKAERVLVEARAASALIHAHAVRVHDVGEHQAQLYLVMDLVEGESLQARLTREGRFPIREAVGIVADVAEALAAAHALGIAHRDVKPENVLMAPGRGALLTDFGLARVDAEERLSVTGELLGTPAYMAPEQVTGEVSQHGPPCDVHALGLLLHELLTGLLPFSGEGFAQLALAITKQRADPPSRLRGEIDADLDAVSLACLAKSPADRPSAAQVAGRLREWLDRREAKRAGQVPLAAAAAVLLLGAIAATAVLVLVPRRSPGPDDQARGKVGSGAATSGDGRPPWLLALAERDRPRWPLRNGIAASERPGVFELALGDGRRLELVWLPAEGDSPGFFIGRDELLEPGGDAPARLSWTGSVEACAQVGGRLPTRDEWRRATRLADRLLHLADRLSEWVQTPEAAPQGQQLLCGGSHGAGASLELARWQPLHLAQPDSGVRVALDEAPGSSGPPLLAWRVEAVAFQPLPSEQSPGHEAPIGRSFEELERVATRRRSLLLPHLDLQLDAWSSTPEAAKDETWVDFFALRATTRALLPAGRWRLQVNAADDGVRVWLDERPVIDVWRHGVWHISKDAERLTHRFELREPTEVALRVEHIELFGSAQLRVWLGPE